jgi:hypothetical protein
VAKGYDIIETIHTDGFMRTWDYKTGERIYPMLDQLVGYCWAPEERWPEVYRVARSMRWLSTPPLPWPTEDVRAQLGSRRQRQDVSMLCDFMGVLMTTNQRDIMERYLRDHPR